ncbi:GntR family transcriptional regulator [Paenibacillus spiritus]|uniref:GntR family transcriptional regulator n=1 Tax=Paenibacillus spiritus TaxID=2496557 RepID=A0A5J5G108_9BACL|nr:MULTISPECIES: GntR family transcriptional regulator [Paenibacillus]KAA9000394.1 GntR family transcriptional regulator [Paenibacillus spiritus]
MIIRLDFKSEVPIYQQLRNAVVIAIGTGELEPGEKLPAIRQLAGELGINAMTVNKAYAMLKAEGFLRVDRRHGASVAAASSGGPEEREKLQRALQLVISEARLHGIGRQEFMDVCTGIFAAMKPAGRADE